MSWRFLVRLLLVLAVLASGVWAGLYFLRPVASVTAVRRDTAREAVAGTLTVQAVPFPLVAEAGGRIAESQLELGKAVKAGDILVRLDTSGIDLAIADLRSRFEAAKKRREIGSESRFTLLNAEAAVTEAERLLANNLVSPNEVELKRRDLERVKQGIALEAVEGDQQLASLENQLKSQELTLGKMTLRASTDGTVTKINAYTDYLVNPGTVIAEIVSTKRTVVAKISEENFASVRVGQAAIVRLSGFGDHPFDGKVSLALPSADAETQRYLVHLDVAIENEKLLPGMTGDALIVVNERANALLIPRAALSGGFVFVVADGRAERRKVEVGYEDLNEAEILSGLEENEFVIGDELERFSDGASVRVQQLARR